MGHTAIQESDMVHFGPIRKCNYRNNNKRELAIIYSLNRNNAANIVSMKENDARNVMKSKLAVKQRLSCNYIVVKFRTF